MPYSSSYKININNQNRALLSFLGHRNLRLAPPRQPNRAPPKPAYLGRTSFASRGKKADLDPSKTRQQPPLRVPTSTRVPQGDPEVLGGVFLVFLAQRSSTLSKNSVSSLGQSYEVMDNGTTCYGSVRDLL